MAGIQAGGVWVRIFGVWGLSTVLDSRVCVCIPLPQPFRIRIRRGIRNGIGMVTQTLFLVAHQTLEPSVFPPHFPAVRRINVPSSVSSFSTNPSTQKEGNIPSPDLGAGPVIPCETFSLRIKLDVQLGSLLGKGKPTSPSSLTPTITPTLTLTLISFAYLIYSYTQAPFRK